ncbi:putative laccase-9 [Vitis vinifera]|uniref:putative laccase-9 n=1 Tax=Vitis vinifera TaxID=29760 RepID=UPI00023B281A|nr:putative laccase-9 [Vitis vinifera]|eukprot:XP_019073404.1 PREDICTED: putative laccase-9 [Vitis vinifera]
MKKMRFLLEVLVPALLTGMLASMAEGRTHSYDFVLKETNFTRLCSTKSMTTVNDSFPGPVIRRVQSRGDLVYVNVHNQDDFGVTIHWHGVKQTRNPWSDGPDHITQCRIQPGTNFTYKVIFGEDQEGTLWWHAHSDWTRATVHGAIVILPTQGTTYPFPKPDGEHLLVLGSWFAGNLNELYKEFLSNQTVTTLDDIAFTINGEPGDLVACGGETTHRWLVDYGKTYLLRIVNAVVNSELFFAISEHNLTIVGTDGTYTKPRVTSYIMIAPGQTMDVLITTNQSLSHYYMAARQFVTLESSIAEFNNMTATAILQYRGNYPPPDVPSFPANLPLFHDLDSGLGFLPLLRSLATPEHPVSVPLKITTRMLVTASINKVNYTFEGTEVSHLAASLNNITFMDPTSSILLAYYRHTSGVYTTDFPDYPPSYYNFTGDTYPPPMSVLATKVKVLNYNESVEIIVQGTNLQGQGEDHPLHLHGYTFYVVGMGRGNFNNETDPKWYNLVDPPERDTITVPKNGWVALRFLANNPGVWLWHCHFDRHLTWGMDTAFIVKNGETPETSILPPLAYMPSCAVQSPIRLEDFQDSIELVNKINVN